MKKLIILLIAVSLISCGKETQDPVFNEFSLIGTWISRDGRTNFNIENTKNIGTTERYLDYQEGSSRLLRRTYNDIPTTFEILFINSYELKIKDRFSTSYIELLRVK